MSITGFGVFSHEGCNHKNEDTYTIKENLGGKGSGIFYAAVYDGHGGPLCSKYLKKVLHLNISKELTLLKLSEIEDEDDRDKIVVTALLNGFAKTENDFIILSTKEKEFSGSCVNVVLILYNKIYVANLGDCRTIMLRKSEDNWKPIQLSRDHKANIEKARISEFGGKIKNGRVNGVLAISRAIGDRDFKNSSPENDVDIKPIVKDPRVIQDHGKIKIKCLTRSASESNAKKTMETSKSSSILSFKKRFTPKKRYSAPKKLNTEQISEEPIGEEHIVITCFDAENTAKIKKIHPPIDPAIHNGTLVSAIPEITIISRLPEDIALVIASDGLYDYLSNKKVSNAIKKLSKAFTFNNETLSTICDILCEEACYKGSQDDITVIIVTFKDLNQKI